MPRVKYEDWKPGEAALVDVRRAVAICQDYRNQGYDLTLRQLYYQFVARGFIPNTQRSYKRLGDIVNKARMAGLMDWDFIEDRTRNLQSIGHFEDPAAIIDVATRAFALDKWADQPTRVEVWVEKEALAGVVAQVSNRHDVSYFSCRGYVSQSEQWGAAQRIGAYIEGGQNVVILHLGDHDPSGIDMTRDIRERITTFLVQDFLNRHGEEVEAVAAADDSWTSSKPGSFLVRHIIEAMANRCGGRDPFEVRRIALNMDQVEEYQPPPNPAKMTDSRFEAYEREYGDESWELDALDPATLDALIEGEILAERDDDLWDAQAEAEEEGRRLLRKTSRRWSTVVEFLEQEAS